MNIRYYHDHFSLLEGKACLYQCTAWHFAQHYWTGLRGKLWVWETVYSNQKWINNLLWSLSCKNDMNPIASKHETDRKCVGCVLRLWVFGVLNMYPIKLLCSHPPLIFSLWNLISIYPVPLYPYLDISVVHWSTHSVVKHTCRGITQFLYFEDTKWGWSTNSLEDDLLPCKKI